MLQLHCHINTLAQKKNVSKSVLSVSAVSFMLCLYMAITYWYLLTPHTLFVTWVLIFLFLQIPAHCLLIMFLIMYIMCSIQSVCLSSLKCHLLLSLSMLLCHCLYTIFLAILFNTFSFTESKKAVLVCNIFSIIALFLLVYVRFYTKIGGRLIYYIAQYKHFFTCFLDYLCVCKSLKIA